VRVVIALGGNALLRRGEPPDDASQRRNVAAAAAAIAGIATEHAVVVTHGNGPQVGLLALQAETCDPGRPHPLDVIGAQTEGMIGYLIEQELRNRLPGRQVATLLTQVAVDENDAAFRHPTKPIGPCYPKDRAERLASERGWSVAPDGDAYRRVVASPEPRRIIELETIRLLLAAGVLVVCAGGGGIPVVETAAGGLRGIEAVIDKDLAAALLATAIGADALLLLTDVDAVYLEWETPRAKPLRCATPAAMRRHAFAPGSMGPKVEAACRFAEATGGPAGIGRLAAAEGILAGRAGTRVQPERTPA
jgi:carbamate kinase